jgi:hypothetical protein
MTSGTVISIKHDHIPQKHTKESIGQKGPLLSLDWLIICCFTSRWRIFHLYGDVIFAGEGQQNLGLCTVRRAFEQGGIYIVPHLLWYGASIFQSPLTTHKGMWRIYSNPDPHGFPDKAKIGPGAMEE